MNKESRDKKLAQNLRKNLSRRKNILESSKKEVNNEPSDQTINNNADNEKE